MKAIAHRRLRPAPPSLHDLPVPEPGEGEVLVRVRTSSVNGFDVAVAGGHLKAMMEHHFPVVLGRDFAGTVAATGAGVQSVRSGEVVFGVLTKPALGDGAFGEYVTAPEAYTALVPVGLDLADGRGAGPGRHRRAQRHRRGRPAAGSDCARLRRNRRRRGVRRAARCGPAEPV